MKPHNHMLLGVLLCLSIACAQDEDLISSTPEQTNQETTVAEDVKPEGICEIDFNSISPGEEVIIDCDYDLNGISYVLPQNVTLKSNGGKLTNGTLVFNSGLIDGDLLSLDLEISGSARLTSTSFTFKKENWNIKEGEVSKEIALENRMNINKAITLVKNLRGYEFEIDNIDAFVEVGAYHFGNYTHREAIQIPSNFHFKMGNECTLRVQPNGNISYAILSARGVSNVKISGGHLIGDKYEHTYTTGTEQDTHEFGTGIYFVGVTNSEIYGVTIDDMTGDSFGVHSTRNRNPDGSEVAGQHYSKNITIKNCVMRGARRNNLSFIDVDGLILENSIIANAGEGGEIDNYGEVYDWRGVLPRCNIDLEATRSFDENGDIKLSQIVQNITIRNNEFTGAWISDINFYTCNNVEVYGNTFTSGLSNLHAQDIFIHDNVFTRDNSLSTYNIGIHMKSFIREGSTIEENYNYEIYDNTIIGFNTGININGDNHKVYNNKIIDCVNTGISLGKGDNHKYYNNTITSTVKESKGYYTAPSGSELTNSTISNETIDVDEYGMLIRNLDSSVGNQPLLIENSTFKSSFRNVDIRNSNSITIKDSQTGTVYQTNNTNVNLINNN